MIEYINLADKEKRFKTAKAAVKSSNIKSGAKTGDKPSNAKSGSKDAVKSSDIKDKTKTADRVSLTLADRGLVRVEGASAELIRMMAGAQRAYNGEIKINGKLARAKYDPTKDGAPRGKVMLSDYVTLADDAFLYENKTAAYNLAAVAALVGADSGAAETLAAEWGFPADVKARDLSAAQRKVLSILNASLSGNALFAVEPVAELTEADAQKINTFLKEKSARTLVVVFSQDSQIDADRVIVFADGKIMSDSDRLDVAAVSDTSCTDGGSCAQTVIRASVPGCRAVAGAVLAASRRKPLANILLAVLGCVLILAGAVCASVRGFDYYAALAANLGDTQTVEVTRGGARFSAAHRAQVREAVSEAKVVYTNARSFAFGADMYADEAESAYVAQGLTEYDSTVTLTHGSAPTAADEVVITDYVAERMRIFKVRISASGTETELKIDSVDQLLGQRVLWTRRDGSQADEVKIVGIAKSGYDRFIRVTSTPVGERFVAKDGAADSAQYRYDLKYRYSTIYTAREFVPESVAATVSLPSARVTATQIKEDGSSGNSATSDYTVTTANADLILNGGDAPFGADEVAIAREQFRYLFGLDEVFSTNKVYKIRLTVGNADTVVCRVSGIHLLSGTIVINEEMFKGEDGLVSTILYSPDLMTIGANDVGQAERLEQLGFFVATANAQDLREHGEQVESNGLLLITGMVAGVLLGAAALGIRCILLYDNRAYHAAGLKRGIKRKIAAALWGMSALIAVALMTVIFWSMVAIANAVMPYAVLRAVGAAFGLIAIGASAA